MFSWFRKSTPQPKAPKDTPDPFDHLVNTSQAKEIFKKLAGALFEMENHPKGDDAIFESIKTLAAHYPPVYDVDERALFITWAIAEIPNARQVCLDMVAPFFDDEIIKLKLFSKLRRELQTNVALCRGTDIDPFRLPSFRDLPKTFKHEIDDRDIPNSLEWQFTARTPFHDALFKPIPYRLPRNRLTEHFLCCAPSGWGKTQLLQRLIASWLDDDPPGMFILDSQDDDNGILRKLEKLEVFNTTLKDRLVILSPEDKPALNLFQITQSGTYDPQLDDLFVYLATAIDREFTAKQATAVLYVLRLLAKIPNANAHTLKDIMESKTPIYQNEIASLDQTAQDFFANQFYSKSEMGATRLQVASRLYTLLSNPNFQAMFAAPSNRFDAYKAMQERKIVLVNTSIPKLGPTGSQVFGRYIIAQCLAAAYRRGQDKERPLCLMILDEAAPYLDDRTEVLLSTARKFNLGFIAATQLLERIPSHVKAALNSNTAFKVAGPVSYEDAQKLAREMGTETTSDFIRSMTKDERSTNFAFHMRGMTKAIKLPITFGILETWPTMSDDAWRAMREANRQRYALDFSVPPAPLVDAVQPTILGHMETVSFPDYGITAQGLLDTGADMTAVPVTNLTFSGVNARFDLYGKAIELPVLRTTTIGGWTGHSATYPVVRIKLSIASHTAEEDCALNYLTPSLLIGRPFLKGRILIDSDPSKPSTQKW